MTAALKRRREILGIVDWRLEECDRLGVEFEYNRYAEKEDVLAEDQDCMVFATGGLPNLELIGQGDELATTSWDILSGGTAPPPRYSSATARGSHPGMTIAEYIANPARGSSWSRPSGPSPPRLGRRATRPMSGR